MRVTPPIDVGDQSPHIDAPAVAAGWARLDDATLLDRLSMLGRIERGLVVAALADLGVTVRGTR